MNRIQRKIPRVALILLNYKNWQDTIECLDSLKKIDYPDYLIAVIDNGSSDSSIEKIKSWAEGKVKVVEYENTIAEQGGIEEFEEELDKYPSDRKIVLIKNNANLGYSAGNNVGIRYAIKKNSDAILIVNPDVRVCDSNTLGKMVEVMFSGDDIYAVGPNIIDAEGNRQSPLREPTFLEECINPFFSTIIKQIGSTPRNYLEPIDKNEPYEVEKIPACCLMLRASFLKRIGLLDEAVFLYCEEPILAAQVKGTGGKIYFIPNIVVKHYHKKPVHQQLQEFFKSRLYFLKEYKKYNSLQLLVITMTHKIIGAVVKFGLK